MFTDKELDLLEKNLPSGNFEIFVSDDEFAAVNAATQRAETLGYSVGRMQAHSPMALFYGDCDISKWRNLSVTERRQIEGAIVGSFRNGPVYLCFPRID